MNRPAAYPMTVLVADSRCRLPITARILSDVSDIKLTLTNVIGIVEGEKVDASI